MNVLLLSNYGALNGTRDEIISRSTYRHAFSTLKPEIKQSKEISDSIKSFFETTVKRIEDKISGIPAETKAKRQVDPLTILIRGLNESKKSAC